MIRPDDITHAVNFQPEFDPGRITYDPELGFLEVDENIIAFGSIRLLGFGAPVARGGGIDTRQVVQPLTELSQLPADVRTISLQGKGVGPRLYNTPDGVSGLPNEPDIIGAYVVNLQRDRLLDIRPNAGGAARQIARHASRIALSKLTSLDAVVERIHQSYGDADAVLLKQPPLPTLRQHKRRALNPEGVPGEFIIIRSPLITLTKVGTVQTYS